jgi:hypothetical protein
LRKESVRMARFGSQHRGLLILKYSQVAELVRRKYAGPNDVWGTNKSWILVYRFESCSDYNELEILSSLIKDSFNLWSVLKGTSLIPLSWE